ncbi:MAG TPA: MOSC N-terminal beta barrel domain-containing protein, partial [Pyrinomonadaceae bacterium]|nr:MOSC N-terminal beta barrel domain-containing protein [Pyrinomonadaceae bacterium]
MHISEINIYPIKSLKGIALDSAVVEARGLEYDRRWMLTTPDGMFFTQRDYPKMATIRVEITPKGLLVSAAQTTGIVIPFEPDQHRKKEVTIWQSVCTGEVYSDGVNDWFSQVLGLNCQLVYMPDDTRRGVNPRFDHGHDIVSFADGYPLMVLGEASLADLNSRLETHLPMNRF